MEAATSTMATSEDVSGESGPISPPGLTTGRRCESAVWDYFVFDASKEESICQVEVSEVGSDGTRKCGTGIAGKFPTNLKAHIKGNHPHEEMLKKEAEKQKEKETTKRKLASPPGHVGGQMTLLGTIQKAKSYDKESPRYKDIARKLATFAAAGNVANRIVECDEFRELYRNWIHTRSSSSGQRNGSIANRCKRESGRQSARHKKSCRYLVEERDNSIVPWYHSPFLH